LSTVVYPASDLIHTAALAVGKSPLQYGNRFNGFPINVSESGNAGETVETAPALERTCAVTGLKPRVNESSELQMNR
jgi:hypothetical protein